MLKRMLKKLSVLCALVTALSGCSPDFDDKPSTGYANGSAPSAPTGLTATVLSATSVRISWNTVSGVDGYIVYCSRSLNGEYLRLSNDFPKPGTSHDDDGCEPGDTWYYKVSAIKGSIANGYWESAKSSAVSATTSNTPGEGSQSTVPSVPTGITATAVSSSSITVSWSAVSGATGYRIYWATSSSGSYSQKESVTSTSFTDTGLSANTPYYYKVSAYNSSGESGQSNYYSATTSSSTPSGSAPSVPTNVTATAVSSSSITVNWSSVSGATGYHIYWATSSSGSYSQKESVTSTSFTDTGLSANTPYYYKVSAYNDSGESEQSSYYSATTLSPTPSIPSAPTNVTATRLSANNVSVTWNPVSGATSYEVYWAYTASGEYTLDGTATSTSFTSTDWGADESGYFKVKAVNGAGSSDYSSIASFGLYSSAPSTGSSLTQGDWTDGVISSGSQYYYFYATSGVSYTVFWNDSYNGDYTKTCDIVVSAYWDSDNTNIFNEDHGYIGQTFTASRTGYVMLKVEPYFSGNTGTFAIKYQ
ncbi:MAG: fibronectin type III domain-containing protein [Treponema sp.]|jgi:fibronectin type 3 domain-containing protein|nr:fibronectin type III domain-containing protein [Treponema sp.]